MKVLFLITNLDMIFIQIPFKMTKGILTIISATCLFFTACQNNSKKDNNSNKNSKVEASKETEIPFTIAKRYFVKNNIKNIDTPKIETAEEFNKIFGSATTMGKDSQPTEIDFSKQFVIAIIQPETEFSTTIKPTGLHKNEKGEIILNYKTEKGEKQTFTTQPYLAIIVDKNEDGAIVLKEQI